MNFFLKNRNEDFSSGLFACYFLTFEHFKNFNNNNKKN